MYIMANKFFGLFDVIGDKFKDSFDSFNTKLKEATAFEIDPKTEKAFSGIEKNIAQSTIAIERFAEQIVRLDQSLLEAYRNNDESAINDILRQKNVLLSEAKAQEFERNKAIEEFNAIAKEEQILLTKKIDKYNLFNKASKDYVANLDEIKKAFGDLNMLTPQAAEAMSSAKGSYAGAATMEAVSGIGAMGKGHGGAFVEGFADGIKSVTKSIMPGAAGGFVGEIIEQIVLKTYERMLQVNDLLVDLERTTGGVITAFDQGSDVFGNIAGQSDSLTTELIRQNLTVGEYKNALVSLSQNGFGQTFGVMQDLNKSMGDFNQFGTEAAKIQKLYGANIAGGVRGLMQHFSLTMGTATQVMTDGAHAARDLGLNVGQFVQHFEEVVGLSGEYYVGSIEAMKGLAMFATQLNHSVKSLISGALETKDITDLFAKQQQTMALGLGNYSAALGRIYAYQQTGQTDKQAKLTYAALGTDVLQGGMFNDKTNRIDKRGLDTLKAQGLSKEQIEGVEANIQQSNRLGVSLYQLNDEAWQAANQLKLMKDEANNAKLSEIFHNIQEKFYSLIVDPLTEAFGPLTRVFAELLDILVEVVGGIISFLGPIFEGFGAVILPIIDALIEFKQMVQDFFKLKSLTGLIDGTVKALKALGIVLGVVAVFVFSLSFPIIALVAGIALLLSQLRKWGIIGDEKADAEKAEAERLKALQAKKGGTGSASFANWDTILPAVAAQNKNAVAEGTGIIRKNVQKNVLDQQRLMEAHSNNMNMANNQRGQDKIIQPIVNVNVKPDALSGAAAVTVK